MLMRIGSPEHDEFVEHDLGGLGLVRRLGPDGDVAVDIERHRGVLLIVAGQSRQRVGQEPRVVLRQLAAGRGVCRIGNDPRHVGKAPVLVDPQIDRPRIDADDHPVAALGDGHRLVLRQFGRVEDLAAGNQQRLAPREREARLDQGLPPVRGVDRAIGRSWRQPMANRELPGSATSDASCRACKSPGGLVAKSVGNAGNLSASGG